MFISRMTLANFVTCNIYTIYIYIYIYIYNGKNYCLNGILKQ